MSRLAFQPTFLTDLSEKPSILTYSPIEFLIIRIADAVGNSYPSDLETFALDSVIVDATSLSSRIRLR